MALALTHARAGVARRARLLLRAGDPPVVDPDDPGFGDYSLWSHFADISAGGLVLAAEKGWVLGPEFDVTPMERDYLRFEDQVWSSVYGGGLSRDELIAEYRKLASRWPDPKASRQRRE